MATWTTIFGLQDPVFHACGSDYNGLAGAYDRVGSLASDISQAFQQFSADAGCQALEGQAADKARDLVRKVDRSLDDLPRACKSVARLLRNHAGVLDHLQAQANQALARARAKWRTKNDREHELTGAQRRLGQMKDQLRRVECNPDASASEVANARYRVRVEESNVTGTRNALRRAEEHLEDERDEYHRILNGVECANIDLARGLVGVDLGDLRDPTGLAAFVGDIMEFLGNVLEGLTAILADLAWRIRDFLDEWGWLVAIVIGVIVSVALLATGAGASAIPWVFVAVSMIVHSTNIRLGVFLAVTKSPHPDTGEIMEWGTVALDIGTALVDIGLSVLLAAMTGGAGSLTTAIIKGSTGRTIAREFVESIISSVLVSKLADFLRRLWTSGSGTQPVVDGPITIPRPGCSPLPDPCAPRPLVPEEGCTIVVPAEPKVTAPPRPTVPVPVSPPGQDDINCRLYGIESDVAGDSDIPTTTDDDESPTDDSASVEEVDPADGETVVDDGTATEDPPSEDDSVEDEDADTSRDRDRDRDRDRRRRTRPVDIDRFGRRVRPVPGTMIICEVEAA